MTQTTPDPIHPASGDLEAVAAAVADMDQTGSRYPITITYDQAVAILSLRAANPPATAAGVGEAPYTPTTVRSYSMPTPASHDALIARVRELADQSSPYDHTGEPLHVRVSKDLTRRVQSARALLADLDAGAGR